MSSMSSKSSPHRDDSNREVQPPTREASDLSPRAAREVGFELARLYREVSSSLPVDRPVPEGIARAERVLITYKLEEKRLTDAPTPTREDLTDLARGIGLMRALKDAYAIRSEMTPLFRAGARCVDALRAVGELRVFREAIQFLQTNNLGLLFDERSHPNGASELGFFIHSRGEVPAEGVIEWEDSIDRVFDTFEDRARYTPDTARRTVRVALDRLRDLHATLKTHDEIVMRHGERVFDAEVPSLQIVRASESLGKRELDLAIPRIQANHEGRAAIYTALLFALREPEIRQTLQVIEGEPLKDFTARLIKRTVTDESPRVGHEINRLADLLKTHAEPMTETRIPAEGSRNSPAMTAHANLAEKLSFLRDTLGDRFEAALDEISRKVGPKIAIDRYNSLKRCCRCRGDEELVDHIISHDPKILTLPTERFNSYIADLRIGVASTPMLPASRLIPGVLGDIVRPGVAPRPVAPVVGRDPREVDVVTQLTNTGLDGEMTLTLLKYGFHHRGGVFTGHHTISRQGLLNIAEKKVDGSRADLEACLDTLIRRGAVIQDSRTAGLGLNRIPDISEPALRAAVSYVESFWAEHRTV